MRTEIDYCIIVEAPHGYCFNVENMSEFMTDYGSFSGDEQYTKDGNTIVTDILHQIDNDCKVEDGEVMMPNCIYVDINEDDTVRFNFSGVEKDEFGNIYINYKYLAK